MEAREKQSEYSRCRPVDFCRFESPFDSPSASRRHVAAGGAGGGAAYFDLTFCARVLLPHLHECPALSGQSVLYPHALYPQRKIAAVSSLLPSSFIKKKKNKKKK
jgi:hypothetical protein